MAATDASPANIQPSSVDLTRWLLVFALLAHLLSLYLATIRPDGIRIGFAQVMSAALCIGMILLWFEGGSPRTVAMRTVVLPLAALAAMLPLVFPGALIPAAARSTFFVPHMVVGILSYAVMLLALVHAILMAMAERSLQGGAPEQSLVNRLPPILAMERMLFRILGIGFVLLSLTAVTGTFFSEQIFGQALRWDHKTFFTLLAWIVFGALLAGRYWRGWRGRTALRLTALGFAVLLLGYAGSRFVLEVVLNRVG